MLLRNFDSAQGHCNGTRYVVKSASANVVEAVVACGSHKGKTLLMPRLVMSQMFSHGQLYVAMSRVGKAEEVKILLSESNNSFDQCGRKFVDNVVYSEIMKKF